MTASVADWVSVSTVIINKRSFELFMCLDLKVKTLTASYWTQFICTDEHLSLKHRYLRVGGSCTVHT